VTIKVEPGKYWGKFVEVEKKKELAQKMGGEERLSRRIKPV
jgi:hypothetical protein